jgi:hypothetical protein
LSLGNSFTEMTSTNQPPADPTQHKHQVGVDNPKLEHRTEGRPKDIPIQGQTAQERLDSYYADKDLAWWIELARDFKRATKVPLPEETEAGL